MGRVFYFDWNSYLFCRNRCHIHVGRAAEQLPEIGEVEAFCAVAQSASASSESLVCCFKALDLALGDHVDQVGVHLHELHEETINGHNASENGATISSCDDLNAQVTAANKKWKGSQFFIIIRDGPDPHHDIWISSNKWLEFCPFFFFSRLHGVLLWFWVATLGCIIPRALTSLDQHQTASSWTASQCRSFDVPFSSAVLNFLLTRTALNGRLLYVCLTVGLYCQLTSGHSFFLACRTCQSNPAPFAIGTFGSTGNRFFS